MRLRRHKPSVPGLNTTSTADISFMLLVFFLVTTSMYDPTGLSRQLPPKDKNEKEQEVNINKENVMALTIDANGKLAVNDSAVQMKDLKSHLEDFILRRGNQHLVTIDVSPACHYDYYFQMQQALGDAYKDARDQLAQKKYGRPYERLTNESKENILNACPQRIAENFHENDNEGMPQKGDGE